MITIPVKQKTEDVIPDSEGHLIHNEKAWPHVYKTCLKYNVYYWENKIYIGKKIADEGADILEYKSYSNFVVRIIQHIDDEKFPIKLVELENTDYHKMVFDTPADRFVDLNVFKRTIEGKGNYIFRGNAVQYEKLKTYLYDQMGTGRKIDVLGWQPEGFWVFNNMVIDTTGELIKIDETGCFVYKGVKYYIPSANPVNLINDKKYIPQKLFVFKESKQTLSSVAEHLQSVHREYGRLGLAFTIATVYSDYIYSIHKGFVMLFLYGEASTGKGQLIEALASFFGNPQPPIAITGKSTDKGKIRKTAAFRNAFIAFEEYNHKAEAEDLKNIWDRYSYEKGTTESAISTEQTPILSSVIMTGNTYPKNDALLTRLLICEMNKNKFNEQEILEFDKFREIVMSGYSSIITELIKLRPAIEREYSAKQAEFGRRYRALMPGTTGRIILNATMLTAVFDIVKKYIPSLPFTTEILVADIVKATRVQNTKREQGNEIQTYFDVLLHCYKINKIQENQEFKVEGNQLYLYFSKIYSHYSIEHFNIYKAAGLDKNSLLDKLKLHAAYVSLKSKRIGESNSTAMVFEIDKIDPVFASDLLELVDRKSVKKWDPPSYGQN
jgi:hypothetical protein